MRTILVRENIEFKKEGDVKGSLHLGIIPKNYEDLQIMIAYNKGGEEELSEYLSYDSTGKWIDTFPIPNKILKKAKILSKIWGKYIIEICNNPSCYLKGSLDLIKFLCKKLKIKSGQTTKDKKFTLTLVECLGACEQAPCMMVNFDYYGNLDKKKIDKILDGLE